MARWLYLRRVPIFPRLITYWIRFFWGAFIPHTATIGLGTRVGYGGLGVVIHERAIIGSGCVISQHVTIGGNGSEVGVPVIGDRVQIGVGAKVLGPIRVGDDAVVGANAVVISDVLPHQVVGGVPAKVLKNREKC
ncbi:MAG: serine acetyltransferase [Deltaproteobacteria bacterium]|nr:serine acetyltransferase [Deltaproteobacteria bacterium]MBW1932246.1 serine acetyltransferase [Deltaproteobacteria bacterium]